MTDLKQFSILFGVVVYALNFSSGLQCYTCLHSDHPLAKLLPQYDVACYRGVITNNSLLKTCKSGERCFKMSLKGNYYAVVRGCYTFSQGFGNRCDKTDVGEVDKFYPGWTRWLGGSSRSGNTCVCQSNRCNSGRISWS